MKPIITVHALWDEKHHQWYATSHDIDGLHARCETLEQLIEVIDDALPELVESNLHTPSDDVPYFLMHSRVAAIHSS